MIEKLYYFLNKKNGGFLFYILINITICLITLYFVIDTISKEIKRTSIIPLAFSEISQIKLEQGTNFGILTECYASINDVSMKVFEANNIAIKKYQNYDIGFARELEIHIDPALKIHQRNITMLLTNMTFIISKALNKMNQLTDIFNKSYDLYNLLSKTWYENHDDVYHTEVYTYTTTDSKGNTTTHTGTRQVYDYTIHTYKFYKEESYKAIEIYDYLINKYEYSTNIFPEILQHAKITHAEGEYALEDSWREIKKGKDKLKNEDIINIINSWNDRTTYNVNKVSIENDYKYIYDNYDNYKNSLDTAKNYYRYITYSHFDSGPIEFQLKKSIQEKCYSLFDSINEIISSLKYVDNNSLRLYDKINEYISIVLDKKKGNKNKLKNDIINLSKDFYVKNFKEGIQLNYFNFLIILYVLIYIIVCIGSLILLYGIKEGDIN